MYRGEPRRLTKYFSLGNTPSAKTTLTPVPLCCVERDTPSPFFFFLLRWRCWRAGSVLYRAQGRPKGSHTNGSHKIYDLVSRCTAVKQQDQDHITIRSGLADEAVL